MPVDQIPRTIDELELLSREIFENIINEYNNNSKGRQFGDSFSDDDTGLIYRCAGSVALLLLVNTFDNLAKKDDWQSIVVNEYALVTEYIKKYGFDATPFVTNRVTKELYSPNQYDYIDSVTWVLSFSILMRYTERSGYIKLGQNVLNEVVATIASCLGIICDAQCQTGGWGFAKDCTKPDLYFSSAVSEALGDFGDYILGETKSLCEPDDDLIKILGNKSGELLTSVKNAREKVAGWIIRDYLPKLGESMIVPLSGQPSEKDLQPDDHNALYYSYFVMTILTSTKAAKLFYSDKASEISKKIEHAIYLSRISLDRAYDDKSYWENPELSALKIQWLNHSKIQPLASRARTTAKKLEEPGLIPMSLRCNILYAYDYAEGADKKIESLISFIIADRNIKNGLWDKYDFVLQITERAVEAIVDYADYLRLFSPAQERSISEEAQSCNYVASTSDGLFRQAVKEALIELIASEDGNQILAPVLQKEEKTTVVSIHEEELANLLIGLIAKCQRYLNGEDDKVKNLSKKTFAELYARIHEIILQSLVKDMSDTVPYNSFNKNDLESKLDERLKQFSEAFITWINNDVGVNLGTIFMYMSNKAIEADAQHKQRGGKK